MSLAAGSQPFSRILNAVVARVATALSIGTEFVRPVAAEDYAVTETENLFAYIRPYAPSPIDARSGRLLENQGAGRLSRVIGRRFRVYIYTRSGVDVFGGDEIALGGQNASQTVATPPTMPGQFIAEEIVLNALDDYQLTYTDNLGNTFPLALGPIHWLDSASGPPQRKSENEEGLVRSHLDFQVVYILAITNTEPAPTTLPVPVQ